MLSPASLRFLNQKCTIIFACRTAGKAPNIAFTLLQSSKGTDFLIKILWTLHLISFKGYVRML